MNNNEKRFTTEQKGTEHKNVIYLFCTSCVLWIQKKAYAESRYLNNNVFFYTIFYEVTYRKLTFFVEWFGFSISMICKNFYEHF